MQNSRPSLYSDRSDAHGTFSAVAGNGAAGHDVFSILKSVLDSDFLHTIQNILSQSLSIHQIQGILAAVITAEKIPIKLINNPAHGSTVFPGCDQVTGAVNLDQRFQIEDVGGNVGGIGYSSAGSQICECRRDELALDMV